MEVFVYVVGGLACLALGGDVLVRGASRLAAILGIPSVVIGLTVVAFGTSTPELAVSLGAALEGNADIAVSNIVGSNTFNVLFILGVSALISPLLVHAQVIRREVPIMIVSSIIFYFFARGGNISRLEGIFLFVALIVYTSWLVWEALQKKKEDARLRQESEEAYSLQGKRLQTLGLSVLLVAVGLGIVMLGAEWMVNGAVQLAKQLNVSDAVIGVTIVAAGTSLPEVVASVIATMKGERDIAIGNVIGSNIYNVMAIGGLSAAIVPEGLNVAESILRFDFLIMLLAAATCWPFFWSHHTLGRKEGAMFLAAYVSYTTYLVLQA